MAIAMLWTQEDAGGSVWTGTRAQHVGHLPCTRRDRRDRAENNKNAQCRYQSARPTSHRCHAGPSSGMRPVHRSLLATLPGGLPSRPRTHCRPDGAGTRPHPGRARAFAAGVAHCHSRNEQPASTIIGRRSCRPADRCPGRDPELRDRAHRAHGVRTRRVMAGG